MLLFFQTDKRTVRDRENMNDKGRERKGGEE